MTRNFAITTDVEYQRDGTRVVTKNVSVRRPRLGRPGSILLQRRLEFTVT